MQWDRSRQLKAPANDCESLFLVVAFIDEHRARALLSFRSSSTYTWRMHVFFFTKRRGEWSSQPHKHAFCVFVDEMIELYWIFASPFFWNKSQMFEERCGAMAWTCGYCSVPCLQAMEQIALSCAQQEIRFLTCVRTRMIWWQIAINPYLPKESNGKEAKRFFDGSTASWVFQ